MTEPDDVGVQIKPEDYPEIIICLQARAERAEAKLAAIQALVNAQAEDEGLWFEASSITEAYLQSQLRALHAVIEGGRDPDL